ncbi:MAG: hypothetical protein FWG52_10145 [Proteobacteria bacterium]|nr:hypothetical protein [Pseudomonadota bacterium]
MTGNEIAEALGKVKGSVSVFIRDTKGMTLCCIDVSNDVSKKQLIRGMRRFGDSETTLSLKNDNNMDAFLGADYK